MLFRAMYTVHFRLIGKRIVDFLSVIIELFSLGVTAKVLRVNIDWNSAFFKQVDQSGLKSKAEGDVLHQPFLVSKN